MNQWARTRKGGASQKEVKWFAKESGRGGKTNRHADSRAPIADDQTVQKYDGPQIDRIAAANRAFATHEKRPPHIGEGPLGSGWAGNADSEKLFHFVGTFVHRVGLFIADIVDLFGAGVQGVFLCVGRSFVGLFFERCGLLIAIIFHGIGLLFEHVALLFNGIVLTTGTQCEGGGRQGSENCDLLHG
tara:strand:+ start:865 stop:1425 length:561 start_codon:yes stop_codon:yes gene_type:complete